jgi:RNA polymerase sigma-70 factor (ECF subfamily)
MTGEPKANDDSSRLAPREDGNDVIERCREGSETAARQLFHQYAGQLLELARQRISQRLASRVDAEDVVQSVFRTFFHRMKAGEFTFRDPDDLCKLLVRITLFKTLRQVAHHQQGKRDARQESPKGDFTQEQLLSVISHDPSPEEAVIFLDELEHFLGELPAADRKICELRIEGYTNTEIAAKLDINERRIRRLMERLRGLAKKEDWYE